MVEIKGDPQNVRTYNGFNNRVKQAQRAAQKEIKSLEGEYLPIEPENKETL